MQDSTTIIGIISMRSEGYKYEDVRLRYNVGSSVITDITRKFKEMDHTLADLKSMDANEIYDLFYSNSHKRENRPLPDFNDIYLKVTSRKENKNLYYCWMEYKKEYPENGYQYTQFKEYYKRWLRENHLSDDLVMAVDRIPGEIEFIDWAGDTLPLVRNPDDPEKLMKAHFFLTTVGVSSYVFAEAFPDEKTPSFLKGTIDSLEYYGAVPKILKPDNTKAAVIKNDKNKLQLNTVYADIQEFYGTVIVPAPPLKPRGKATVENHVRWLETHLLEPLRGKVFNSFKDLNDHILVIIDDLNERPFQKKENGNRKQLFEQFDKVNMKPLPKDSFAFFDYKTTVVPNNYHIEYDNHYYSVPHTYYKQLVTLKASFFDIIITDPLNRVIARHKRSYIPYPKYLTIEEHMPASHAYYYIENHYTAQTYKNWAKSYGNNLHIFISRMIAGFQYEEQSYKSCNGVLHMCKDVPKAIVEAVAQECIDINVYNYTTFRTILKKYNDNKRSNDDKLPDHKNIRGKDNYK